MCTEIHKELGHPSGNVIRTGKNTCTKSKHSSMALDQLCKENHTVCYLVSNILVAVK
jgi:hypothetical protein